MLTQLGGVTIVEVFHILDMIFPCQLRLAEHKDIDSAVATMKSYWIRFLFTDIMYKPAVQRSKHAC